MHVNMSWICRATHVMVGFVIEEVPPMHRHGSSVRGGVAYRLLNSAHVICCTTIQILSSYSTPMVVTINRNYQSLPRMMITFQMILTLHRSSHHCQEVLWNRLLGISL
jgi:hypothetical protein